MTEFRQRTRLHQARRREAQGHPADADARYRGLLDDDSTFASMTLEDLLAAKDLPRATTSAIRGRYLPR
jgi:hypothetical protein